MNKSIQEWRIRLQLSSIIISLVGGFVILLVREELMMVYNLNRLYILTWGMGSISVGITLFLLLYLNGELPFLESDRVARRSSSTNDMVLSKLQGDIEKLGSEVDQISKGQVGAAVGDPEELREILRSHVAKDLATELERRFAKQAVEAAYLDDVRQVFVATSERLLQEINALTRRGNLNLIIGMLTTVWAVGLLIYMVFYKAGPFDNITVLLSYFIPRITTVAFIEVFAFFFLQLYKSSLTEVKFYQNELTALATQRIALDASKTISGLQAPMLVLEHIARRNPNAVTEKALQNGAGDLKGLTDLLERVAKMVAGAAKAEGGK